MAASAAQPRSLLPVVRVCDNVDQSSPPPDQVSFFLSPTSTVPVGHVFRHVFQQVVADTVNGVLPEFASLASFPTPAGADRLYFADGSATFQERSAAMAAIAASWRARGLFQDALGGWRDELYTIYGPEESTTAGADACWGRNGAFALERAACALFGVGTFGIHVNGFVEDDTDGTYRVWVPRRAKTKQTFPSMLDQIVAGGLTHGLAPTVCVVKECAEEASIPEDLVLERGRLKAAGVITYTTRVAEGWIQPETQYIYDLKLPPPDIFTPTPSDGEAESFELLSMAEVLDNLHRGLFKPNCALVMVDFLVRHAFLTPENEPHLIDISRRLHATLAVPGIVGR